MDGVSFQVQAGQFFSLLGPNGAGKTTTISILTTTLLPTGGRVTVAGHDVVSAASQVRRNIGIIFQKPSLDVNLTAEENVRFHATLYGLYPFRLSFSTMPVAYRRQVRELAAVLGIEKEMFEPIKTFSGGMMRKLEIVRSLIHHPRVLFLDEPTSGLDPLSRRNLWAYLRDVRKESGLTIFLTTHYLEEAEEADSICIINEGKVVSSGTPTEVRQKLAEEFVLVDAGNRELLRTEMMAKAIPYDGDGPFRIKPYGRPIHQLLKDIDTPLTLVRTHSASLEDAYLRIVGGADED